MTRTLRHAALAIAILALPITLQAQGLGVTAAIFRQFLVDYWDWRLGDEPELATHVGVPTFDHRWRDWSPEARARAREARQEFLQRLVYIATGTLSPAERLSADLLLDDLRAELDAGPWLELTRRVSPQHGLHHEVVAVITQMPARTVEEYERVLARLRALPSHVDQQIATMRGQLARGLAQPRETVARVIAQVEAQRAAGADDSPLLVAFRDMPAALDAGERQRLQQEARVAYAEHFVPAWSALLAFLRDTYLPAARSDLALSSLPDGAAGYRALLRAYTGLPLTPEQIHALGHEEVARIEGEMTRILREAAFEGSPGAFEQALADQHDVRLDGDGAVLAYAADVLARLEQDLQRVIPSVPRARLDVRAAAAHRVPPGGILYAAGTPDGSRPAALAIDPSRRETRLSYRLEPLVLMGGLPGRHAQVGTARENAGLPAYRRALDVPVFSNGWALYAQSLGTEMASTFRTAAARFGSLAEERRHAAALVADTGLHALGWSRARAEEYLARRAAGGEADLDWYIGSPAEAVTYKLGEMRIREQRRRAERELGPWFDVREFHEAVLRGGAVPLDVLDEQITAYIAATRGTVQ